MVVHEGNLYASPFVYVEAHKRTSIKSNPTLLHFEVMATTNYIRRIAYEHIFRFSCRFFKKKIRNCINTLNNVT